MYTDDNGIVRFESLDNIAPLQVGLNAALESVSDSLTDTRESIEGRLDSLEEDTGWVDVTLEPGFAHQGTGRFQVRRIGNLVYPRWGVSNSGITAINTTYTVGTLPDPIFYPAQTVYASGGSSSARATPSVVIFSSGNIQVRTNTVVGGYFLFSGLVWPTD